MTTWDARPTEAPFADFDELATALMSALATLFRSLTEPEHGRAVVQITSQLVNDCVDLLFQLRDGNGRPAARTTRAQIENLINLASVRASDEAAARYADHSDVVGFLLAQYRAEHDLVSPRDEADSDRLEEFKARYDSVLATYGSSFRRRWASRSIGKRIASHGLSDFNDYCELSSMVVHSAAGGMFGTLRPINEYAVFRVGPALELCPDAYREGLLATREACKLLHGLIDAKIIEVPVAILDLLLESHSEYVQFMHELDSTLWPSEPPDGLIAVRAVARNGRVRWYSWDRASGTLREAFPPDDEQFDFGPQDTMIAQMWQTAPLDQRWITIQLEGQIVQPLPWAPVQPDSTILQTFANPDQVHRHEIAKLDRKTRPDPADQAPNAEGP